MQKTLFGSGKTAIVIALAFLVAAADGAAASTTSGAASPEVQAAFEEVLGLAVQEGALSEESKRMAMQLARGELPATEMVMVVNKIANDLTDAALPSANSQAVIDERVTTVMGDAAFSIATLRATVRAPFVPAEPAIPTVPRNPEMPEVPGGDSCAEDCVTEFTLCVIVCVLAWATCVAGTSGWGIFLCTLSYLACRLYCKEVLDNCLERCQGGNVSSAITEINWIHSERKSAPVSAPLEITNVPINSADSPWA